MLHKEEKSNTKNELTDMLPSKGHGWTEIASSDSQLETNIISSNKILQWYQTLL